MDWSTANHPAMAEEWRRLIEAERSHATAEVARWEHDFQSAKAAEQALIAAGRWRGGPRTLLAAIGVQYLEVRLTAGLAWLLHPDGHHRLGRGLLAKLLGQVRDDGVEPIGDIRVVCEETRGDTRADLVVYGPDWTVVVEAKTFSTERPRQLDRLYELWQDEPAPVFVFLSRSSRQPLMTAEVSGDHWRRLTWRGVAALIRAATAGAGALAPGVHDYTETLELYYDD